jgi:hypothetical protein
MAAVPAGKLWSPKKSRHFRVRREQGSTELQQQLREPVENIGGVNRPLRITEQAFFGLAHTIPRVISLVDWEKHVPDRKMSTSA